jgi:hypothetical protein
MSDKNGTPAVKLSVDELRAEIKQTRAELGETVQALAAKADVKARAMDQVEQTKQRVMMAAAAAGERVRTAAGQATEKVKENASLDGAGGRVKGDGAVAVRGRMPVALMFAGVVAIVGVVLIIRGRRR